jgi:hypothetical protein
MLIGKDFQKLTWHFSGYDFLEPNALIGDTLILIIALIFARKIHQLNNPNPFFRYWTLFLVLFGVSFFMGGLGHFCYNYWGIRGKYFSWFAGMFSAFIIEYAMISIYPKSNFRKYMKWIASIKLVLFLLLEIFALYLYTSDADPQKGLLLPTVYSFIGLGLTLGFLSLMYQRKISGSFRYFWMSTLVLLPNILIQGLKINLHPYFDRNDFSHLLLIVSMFFYFKALHGINKELNGRLITIN